MNQKLAKLIAERKKQAKDRNIWHKADTVAKWLGRSYQEHKNSYGSSETTDTYSFEDGPLKIFIEDMKGSCSDGGFGGYSCKVFYDGRIVFNPSDGYIPGEWEKELDRLFLEAEKAKETRTLQEQQAKRQERRKEEKEEAAKWGLE